MLEIFFLFYYYYYLHQVFIYKNAFIFFQTHQFNEIICNNCTRVSGVTNMQNAMTKHMLDQ